MENKTTSEDALDMSSTLPAILILGGCGFVGRNLVHYLVTENLASFIKVADKAMPEMSYFHDKFMEAFHSPVVQYEQDDLTKPAHIARAFSLPSSVNKAAYDVVVNLAAETRQGQPAELYASRCSLLARKCSLQAVESGVRRFIQVSTAQVYRCVSSSNSGKPSTEQAAIDPWTEEARCTYEGEKWVRQHKENLEVVVLRLAYVYGGGDSQAIMTRAVCGAAYFELKEEMTLLWGARMKINTVHVFDVCRSLVHCMDRTLVPCSSTWNICDSGDTDQGRVSSHIQAVLGVRCGYYGRIISSIAGLRLRDVANMANEKHLKPWNDLCMRDGVLNTPLSPFMAVDWLDCRHLHVSGAAIEATGFQYSHPEMTEELFRESIQHAVECHIFPPSCFAALTK